MALFWPPSSPGWRGKTWVKYSCSHHCCTGQKSLEWHGVSLAQSLWWHFQVWSCLYPFLPPSGPGQLPLLPAKHSSRSDFSFSSTDLLTRGHTQVYRHPCSWPAFPSLSSSVSLTEVLWLTHTKATRFGLPVTCTSEQSSYANFISEIVWGQEWCVREECTTPLPLTGRPLGLLWPNAAGETGWCPVTQQWEQLRGQGNASLRFQVFYKERMNICLYLHPSSGLKFERWKTSRVAGTKIWNWVSP